MLLPSDLEHKYEGAAGLFRRSVRNSAATAGIQRATTCLDPKILHQKISHQMFGYMYGVLNKIYL